MTCRGRNDSLAMPRSKACREKLRRERLNDRHVFCWIRFIYLFLCRGFIKLMYNCICSRIGDLYHIRCFCLRLKNNGVSFGIETKQFLLVGMGLLLARCVKEFGKQGHYVSFGWFGRQGIELLLGRRCSLYKGLSLVLFFFFGWRLKCLC